jgi:glycosyltransferase involved in cell wall biosynthesis
MFRNEAYCKVDKFIANSQYVARVSAMAAGIDPDAVGVVSPPVNVESGFTNEVMDRPRFLPEGRFILFVGAMGPHKGLDVLLDAHQALSEPLPLVILGYPRADSPDCNRPGVTVVTDVPHNQVLASMSAATIGVVPSVCAEAFGRVAVEAMSRGTPMIVSAVGGLQEVVQNELSGLIVPPGDRPALTSALERLIADESLIARLGTEARLRAQDYTVAAATSRLSKYYAEALLSAAARETSSLTASIERS